MNGKQEVQTLIIGLNPGLNFMRKYQLLYLMRERQKKWLKRKLHCNLFISHLINLKIVIFYFLVKRNKDGKRILLLMILTLKFTVFYQPLKL